MRVAIVLAVTIVAALALLVRCCDSANVRRFAGPDDEDGFRALPLYRDYHLLRRAARADDAFDDYGHLRFGRSDD